MHAIFKLRSRRYEVSILPFPATRWQYTSWLAEPEQKVVDARVWRRIERHRAETRNARVPLRGGHRLAENLRLARALGFQSRDDDLTYWLPQSWRAERLAGTLGIHPGSMAYKGNESKRWPYDRFVALARSQAASGKKSPLFLGPHETNEARLAERDFGGTDGISIVCQPLAEAARELAQCEVFVGNDAGLYSSRLGPRR